jgi:hypothetical protein
MAVEVFLGRADLFFDRVAGEFSFCGWLLWEKDSLGSAEFATLNSCFPFESMSIQTDGTTVTVTVSEPRADPPAKL